MSAMKKMSSSKFRKCQIRVIHLAEIYSEKEVECERFRDYSFAGRCRKLNVNVSETTVLRYAAGS